MKKQILNQLHQLIDLRIKTAEDAMNAAKESKNSETKSSAGDKYETGRAMMQFEQEKNEVQFGKAKQLKELLLQIDPEKEYENIGFGSLVITDKGKYFMLIGVGKVEADGEIYFVISPNAPMGKLLNGKKVGELVEFRGQSFSIEVII